jgi:hypothetical protein
MLRIASELPKGDPTRREILATLQRTAREDAFVKKVRQMTDEERKKLPWGDQSRFNSAQVDPYAKVIVDKAVRDIAKEINSTSRGMTVYYIDVISGALRESPYRAQGLLEHVIPIITKRLEDMV